MRRITRITVGTLATAALLTGGGGIALAAHQTDSAAITATAAGTGTTGATATGAAGTAAAPVTTSAYISSRKAVQIAKKRVPGARVSDVEREWEHGQRAWKVELHKGAWEYDVYVSAKTGKIIKLKRDYDD
ncbi:MULTISPECIES: PepSY domain-containing protein [unclassified Streptosporangium]|uniref:PepSY domain-containing protein n=1 Tax=unclassified Streptosporangium TaxID=2632669 RepID=UPI002E2AD08C|nr:MULTISPECIES: PepSY domain-containing protein [unclassified Streptosporangium]